MSGKFLSVDNWLSLDKKATYYQDNEYKQKGKGGGGEALMNHSRKGGMTGNNTVLGVTPCSWLWTFPPGCWWSSALQESFTNEILNPQRDRVNWVHFGRVAYPCTRQLGPGSGSYCTQVWLPGAHPWCEGVFPEKGDSGEALSSFTKATTKPGWRAPLPQAQNTLGRETSQGRCEICADPPWHTISYDVHLSCRCLSGDRSATGRVVGDDRNSRAERRCPRAHRERSQILQSDADLEFAREIWSCENTAGSRTFPSPIPSGEY